MTLYAGDRAPKAVAFPLDCGVTDPTLVDSVRVMVAMPTGVTAEWTATIAKRSEGSIAVLSVLAADGSSVPVDGEYVARLWAYDDNGDRIFDTLEQPFKVEPRRVDQPID